MPGRSTFHTKTDERLNGRSYGSRGTNAANRITPWKFEGSGLIERAQLTSGLGRHIPVVPFVIFSVRQPAMLTRTVEFGQQQTFGRRTERRMSAT